MPMYLGVHGHGIRKGWTWNSVARLFLLEQIDEAKIDVLATGSLFAVDGEGVDAGFQRGFGLFVQGDRNVIVGEAGESEDELAVDVNFRILVVVDKDVWLIEAGD